MGSGRELLASERRTSCMRRAHAVVALSLAAACAGAAPAPALEPPPPLRTTVYLLADGGRAPIGVRRALPRRTPFAHQALAALLEGPSQGERARGFGSALPPGARIRGFSIAPSLSRQAGTATVDLSGLSFAGPTSAPLARAATQVARTVIGLSGIERVRLRADGRPWPFRDHRGRVLDLTVDYRTLLGWTRVCPILPGPTSCFSALP
jgi:hypothetical protein